MCHVHTQLHKHVLAGSEVFRAGQMKGHMNMARLQTGQSL
jgi:hypothetical protein